MPINRNKLQYDKGLEDRQRVMDLITAGAYDNYTRNSTVPESQLSQADLAAQNITKNTSAYRAPYLAEAYESAFGSNQNPNAAGPFLPSLERAAEAYAVSQNPLYSASKGIGPANDQQLYNQALSGMDLALQERQQNIKQQLSKKIQKRNPNLAQR